MDSHNYRSHPSTHLSSGTTNILQNKDQQPTIFSSQNQTTIGQSSVPVYENSNASGFIQRSTELNSTASGTSQQHYQSCQYTPYDQSM